MVDDHEMGITHVFRGEVRLLGSLTEPCHNIHVAMDLLLGMAPFSTPSSRHFRLSQAFNTYIRTFSYPTQLRRF